MATVRYLVNDVDEAAGFYRRLGFALQQQFGPAMAILHRDNLALWLAGPGSSAARALPTGGQPAPGGWARFVLEVENVEQAVGALKAEGVKFRGGVTRGPGGAQALAEDPSGNLIELFSAP